MGFLPCLPTCAPAIPPRWDAHPSPPALNPEHPSTHTATGCPASKGTLHSPVSHPNLKCLHQLSHSFGDASLSHLVISFHVTFHNINLHINFTQSSIFALQPGTRLGSSDPPPRTVSVGIGSSVQARGWAPGPGVERWLCYVLTSARSARDRKGTQKPESFRVPAVRPFPV